MTIRLFVEVEVEDAGQVEPEVAIAMAIHRAVRPLPSVVQCEAYPIPPLLKG